MHATRDGWDNWRQDLHFAWRQVQRAPLFFTLAAVTLGLGIAAASSIFSVISGVLLRPLPYPNGDRIVQLWEVNGKGNETRFADPNFVDVRTRTRSFSAVAQANDAGVISVSGPAEPLRTKGAVVSRDFFKVMGVTPMRGRAFTDDEMRENAQPAVIVSESFWRHALNGDAAALGRTLSFADKTFTIVGIMPPGFHFPYDADLWVPRELEAPLPSRSAHNWEVVARLADGVGVAEAQRDVHALATQLKTTYGDDITMTDIAVVTLRDQIAGGVKSTLGMLMGGSLLLLLIACANVVNLLVARMTARQGELAVRAALGASRRRLAQQCLAEALMLAFGASVIALALTAAGVKLLLRLEPGTLPRTTDVRVDWPVFGFALGVSVLTAVIMGLLTAWRSTRGDLRDMLAQSQRTLGGGRSSERVRRSLVVGQVAMAVILLVATGLFARSFARVLAVNPGFQTRGRVVLDIVPGGEAPARIPLYDEVLARLRAIPGVTAAGGSAVMPLSGASAGDGLFIIMSSVDEKFSAQDFERLFRDKERTGSAEYRVASDGYFEAMDIPLLRGRSFEARDVATAPHVAVISESLARTRWPGRDPIGQVIEFGNMDGNLTPFTIVGIVGDVREANLAATPRPTFYATYRQRPVQAWRFNFIMATRDPAGTTAAARRVMRELRPDLPPRIRTIDDIVSGSVADRRFVLSLVSAFGVIALILAAMGVYSVISYLVTERRRELSIRVALGARTQDIVGLVLRQGLVLSLGGMVVGLAAALVVSRLIASMLYGVSATDPVAFAGVIGVLIIVALLASLVPARRAARARAMDVMRVG
ncbi:MAG TPA: ABC transporter permease [Gemmatimonadaceae bacterium]|nr:ABC transporter permease [Gemmatimonadaceae bacterium]